MPITKQYLRYQPAGIFGIVASRTCNAVFLEPSKFVATGGTNAVILWDTMFNRKLRTLPCESPATILRPNTSASVLAVGHFNGSVSLFDVNDKSEDGNVEPTVTFEGHTSEITALCWDDETDSSRPITLVTGSKDTKITIWDTFTESGITKLKGHKGPITQIHYWKGAEYLLSSSQDSTLRVWNMVTYDCVHTIAGNSKIWDFSTWGDEYILIAESQIGLYRLTRNSNTSIEEFTAEELGTVLRNAGDRRTAHIQVVNDRYLIAVGPKSAEVEVFRLSNTKEIEKRVRKRLKKGSGSAHVTVSDLVSRENSLKASEGKLKSIDIVEQREGSFKVLCCLSSNQMELLTRSPPAPRGAEVESAAAFEQKLLSFDGHSTMIRSVAISSDKRGILTASSDAIKLWNRDKLACVLTLKHEYTISACKFCPADRHFIAGTTSGLLLLGSIANCEIIQVEQSSEDDTVWDIDVYPNERGFAATSGSYVEFYDFAMSDGKLKFELKRRQQLEDKAVCVKISPDMKYLALGLLSSNILVFRYHTLKLHVTLYGHSLPITGIDISSDSQLLASCAGDKTVRVWSMDFGDCRTSMLHAGAGGIIGCSFIENTHHIASVATNTVNFYDGDSHERIQTVKGHCEGGATCMAVGGLHVVSAGRDQTIRLFSRTQEILVLSDEREKELEEALEVKQNDLELPSVVTADTMAVADKFITALDVFREKPGTHPEIMAYGAKDYKEYIYNVFQSAKASEIEQSFLLLPVSYVHQMIPAIKVILENYPFATELALQLLETLMKFHLSTLNSVDKELLRSTCKLARERLTWLKDVIGFNLAAAKFQAAQDKTAEQEDSYKVLLGERKRKKQRKEKLLKRAILQV